MTDHLFVYGTLMRAASASRLGREQRARLDAAGTWLGGASMTGRLYDKGRYPLLVAAAEAGDVVHGEIFLLHDAAAAFAWLDPYESIPPGRTAGDEYARVIRPARLDDGRTLAAWVYLCTADVAALPRVTGGRWRRE